MNVVERFMQEVAELQEKYGLYIVTETEEPIIVSLEPNANNHNIVCFTNNTMIDTISENAEYDEINLGKVATNE